MLILIVYKDNAAMLKEKKVKADPNQAIIDKFRDLCGNCSTTADLLLIKDKVVDGFEKNNRALTILYAGEILHSRKVKIMNNVFEAIFQYYSNELFKLFNEIILKSRYEEAINIFAATAINSLDKNEANGSANLEMFIKDAINILRNENAKCQAAFVDAVIGSANISALIALLSKTKNVETAKESMVVALYKHLREIKTLDDSKLSDVRANLHKLVKATLPEYSQEVIYRFLEKFIKSSAQKVGVEVKQEKWWESSIGKLQNILNETEEDTRLESKLYLPAMVEMVHLHSMPVEMIAPSLLIGINTRKKIARTF